MSRSSSSSIRSRGSSLPRSWWRCDVLLATAAERLLHLGVDEGELLEHRGPALVVEHLGAGHQDGHAADPTERCEPRLTTRGLHQHPRYGGPVHVAEHGPHPLAAGLWNSSDVVHSSRSGSSCQTMCPVISEPSTRRCSCSGVEDAIGQPKTWSGEGEGPEPEAEQPAVREPAERQRGGPVLHAGAGPLLGRAGVFGCPGDLEGVRVVDALPPQAAGRSVNDG